MIILDKIVSLIFPIYELVKKTKKINKKIKSLEDNPEKYSFEYAAQYAEVPIGALFTAQNNTLKTKTSLEDKAKSSLIAITIAATLIFSVINILQNINSKQSDFIVLFIFGLISLIYMVSAGLLSLYNISEINRTSIFSPKHHLLSEEEKHEQLALNVEYNYLTNINRNNFMYASYKCMMVSIFLFIIVFIISSISVFNQSNEKSNFELKLNTTEQSITILKNEFETEITDVEDKLLFIKENLKEEIVGIEQRLLLLENEDDNKNEIKELLKEIKQNLSKLIE